MIFFDLIRYKNLLSSGNYWTEINLSKSQNTLIIGKNGSGKSTILDALCLVLFGKPFREINKPTLVNSFNQKDCLVEVLFREGGKSYKVVRGIKPNVFEIYKDGVLLNQDSANKDYQEILEKTILKFNYKSFKQIVILGSASFTPFMQLDAKIRREIIEDLLDIQIFSTMNTIVKDKITTNKDVTLLKKKDLEFAKQKYEIEKRHLYAVQEDTSTKIEQLENQIKTANNEIKHVTKVVDELVKQYKETKKETVGKVEIEDKIRKMIRIESTVEGKVSKHKHDITFFEDHDDCPTCRQIIDGEFKVAEIERLGITLEELNSGLGKLNEKIKEENSKLSVINGHEKTLQSLQIKIATNNTTVTETKKYITKLLEQIGELNKSNAVSVMDDKVLREIEEESGSIESELKKLSEDKQYLEEASLLLKDTGIKTKIIKQYLPIINRLVNKYLTDLDFFVNFNLDESFKETIKSRHRDEFTYNNFSEGEKQRIDMSLMLTWRIIAKLKNSSNTNLLFLDEIFDSSLDDDGTEYLMHILHMLDDVNLFVISHKGDIMQDKFNEVIKFQKIKNFSRIVT